MENTAEPEIVEDFYGVYLLYNINPKFKGRTYIGYTRDPGRRIMQHNRGTWAGGAHRTNNRGPWKMVMIVHGFPNNISALRFEWAWQNPNKTTRLQHLDLKKIPRKESEYQFKLRVLSEMLRVGPWCRLPLMIRWLENEYREEFLPERKPPDHMPIIQGPVKSYNRKKNKHITTIPTIKCLLCSGYLKDDEKLRCTNINCDLVSHLCCLANLFLPPGEYIPIHGNCPFCNTKLKWGDLIRKMNGYDQGIKDLGENDEEVCTQGDGFKNYDEDDNVVCTQDELFDKEDDYEGDVLKNREFVDNFDEDDEVIFSQDFCKLSDHFNDAKEEIATKNKKLADNIDKDDDILCSQNYNKAKLSARDRDLDKGKKYTNQNVEFVDNLDRHDDDDVVCTQDYNGYGRNNDVVCARNRDFNNVDKDDDVVCTQNRGLNNFDTENGVIRTRDVNNSGDKNDTSDDSDNEILLVRNKVYDEQPSWFLDCNDDL